MICWLSCLAIRNCAYCLVSWIPWHEMMSFPLLLWTATECLRLHSEKRKVMLWIPIIRKVGWFSRCGLSCTSHDTTSWFVALLVLVMRWLDFVFRSNVAVVGAARGMGILFSSLAIGDNRSEIRMSEWSAQSGNFIFPNSISEANKIPN